MWLFMITISGLESSEPLTYPDEPDLHLLKDEKNFIKKIREKEKRTPTYKKNNVLLIDRIES